MKMHKISPRREALFVEPAESHALGRYVQPHVKLVLVLSNILTLLDTQQYMNIFFRIQNNFT